MTGDSISEWMAKTSTNPEHPYMRWPTPDGFEAWSFRRWRESVERHAFAEGVVA